ncbi:porin [Nannocystaceae bacterium ST9]
MPAAKVELDESETDESKANESKTDDETAEKKSEKKKPKKKYDVDVDARVVAGARLVSEQPAIDSQGQPVGLPVRKGSLDLRQARVGVDARYKEILRARLTIDLADLLDTPKPGKVLRNAWVNVRVHPLFQIRAGHFKRPYSRLELRGFSSIPFIGRGLFNGLAVEGLGWGDRAVGMQLWGDIEPGKPGFDRLRWAVSVTNNALSGAAHGVDAHARLVYDPTHWLSIGANGAFKNIQDPLADEATCRSTWKRGDACRRNVFAAGGDVAFDVADFYASVEVDLAQDWLYADSSPWILGALAFASYDIEVGKRTRLQPVLFGEYIDTNLTYGESEAVRAGGAFNVLWTKHLRIIPQIEFVKPLAPVTSFNRFVARQVYGVWIAVQL